ncbi:MAG: DUF6941 family protein [Minisyncoccota bacterium]
MKVRAFLVADAISITSEGGKLVIEGVFDSIFSKSFPARHKSLSTILIFDDEKKEFEYKLFFKHKNKRIQISETKFTKEKEIHRVISRLKDLIIPEEGEYSFEAELDGKIVASYSIIVKQI